MFHNTSGRAPLESCSEPAQAARNDDDRCCPRSRATAAIVRAISRTSAMATGSASNPKALASSAPSFATLSAWPRNASNVYRADGSSAGVIATSGDGYSSFEIRRIEYGHLKGRRVRRPARPRRSTSCRSTINGTRTNRSGAPVQWLDGELAQLATESAPSSPLRLRAADSCFGRRRARRRSPTSRLRRPLRSSCFVGEQRLERAAARDATTAVRVQQAAPDDQS